MKNKIATLILSVLMLASCNSNESNARYSKEKIQSESHASQSTTYAGDESFTVESELDLMEMTEPPQSVDRPPSKEKIIKTGNMSFLVEQIQNAKARVDSILQKTGGYFEDETYHSSPYSSVYNLRLRIPSHLYDEVVSAVTTGVGKLQSKSIKANNVTKEYQDIEIRLENNRAYLIRYQQLLSKAKSIKDIIEIQEKIRRIEIEIDSKMGRLKYLSDQVAYGTIDIVLTENHTYDHSANEPSFLSRMGKAFMNGIEFFKSTILFFINVWPFVLGILLLFIFRRRIWKRMRGKTNG